MRYLFGIGLILCLLGCKQPLSFYGYLENPKLLQKASHECETGQRTDCQDVDRAIDIYNELISDMQENQQTFGERILLDQQACAGLIASTLYFVNDPNKQIDACKQAKIRLAFVGLTSPN